MENLVELLKRHQTTGVSSKEKSVGKSYPIMRDETLECPIYCPTDCRNDCTVECTDCTFCEYQS